MDIFDSPKRTREDSLKKPLNFPEASVTEKRLRDDHES